jgi:hypothetical protein
MGQQDASVVRAFRITNEFLRRIAAAKGLDLDDVPVSTYDNRQASRQGSTDRDQWRVQRRQDNVNWGPDGTVSQGGSELHQVAPFALDPIFLLGDDGHSGTR